MVDRMWGGYERRLPDAIAALAGPAERTVAAQPWIGAIIPFVAGLFVRGPEFNRRFENRPIISSMREHFDSSQFSDNTNIARLFEMQRLIYPVATALWTIAHLTIDPRLPTAVITTDIGYCLMKSPGNRGIGYAIPLRPDMILVLHQGPGNMELRWDGEEWVVEGIQRWSVPAWNVAELNLAMAGTATEIYGSTEATVDACAKAWEDTRPEFISPHAPGPGWLAPDPRLLREQEMFRFKLSSAIASPPEAGAPTILRLR